MKTVNKIIVGIAAVLGLGLTVATVHAQQGPMGNCMGSGTMCGAMMQVQMIGPNSPMKIMQQLMTPAERLDMMDKMADAKTLEELQAIMISTHAEMETRAKEKGITLPAQLGQKMMLGRNCR